MTKRPAILGTGGAGYIGSHCTMAFDAAGYKAVTYDNLSTGHRSFAAGTLVVGNSNFRTTQVGSGGTLTDAVFPRPGPRCRHCSTAAGSEARYCIVCGKELL